MELIQPQVQDQDYDRLRRLVMAWAGISLGDTKRHLVQSRLQKRVRVLGLTDFGLYCDYVESQGPDSAEASEFINCITTNKTDFFREPHHFEYVRHKLVPELIQSAQSGRPKTLRVWHAGCSTGEEPYTMAMVLLDEFRDAPAWNIKLLATDIDTNVLEHAERGVYEREKGKPIPAELLHRYFLDGQGRNAGLVQAGPDLKSIITFGQLNLLADPWPFKSDTRFDVIFCRNVVIYFDKPTQQRLFHRFAQMLAPHGHLFVGHSENLMGITNEFSTLGGTIHRRLDPIRAAA